MENINKPQDYKKKQQKRTRFDVSNISCPDDEQKYKLVSSSFPEYITIESKEKTPMTSRSPFIIKKILSTNISPNMVKKLKNGTLLIQINKKKHAEFLLKMKMFHNLRVNKTLNKSKGVIRSAELSLCSIEEIEKELKNQSVLEAKIIIFWRNDEPIKTSTYILTFDKP